MLSHPIGQSGLAGWSGSTGPVNAPCEAAQRRHLKLPPVIPVPTLRVSAAVSCPLGFLSCIVIVPVILHSLASSLPRRCSDDCVVAVAPLRASESQPDIELVALDSATTAHSRDQGSPAAHGSRTAATQSHCADHGHSDRLTFHSPPQPLSPRERRHLLWAEAVKRCQSRAGAVKMKFSHSLQFNSVPDWNAHYIAYDNLKKL